MSLWELPRGKAAQAEHLGSPTQNTKQGGTAYQTVPATINTKTSGIYNSESNFLKDPIMRMIDIN